MMSMLPGLVVYLAIRKPSEGLPYFLAFGIGMLYFLLQGMMEAQRRDFYSILSPVLWGVAATSILMAMALRRVKRQLEAGTGLTTCCPTCRPLDDRTREAPVPK